MKEILGLEKMSDISKPDKTGGSIRCSKKDCFFRLLECLIVINISDLVRLGATAVEDDIEEVPEEAVLAGSQSEV